MFHPTIKLSDVFLSKGRGGYFFNIIQVGTGGTGGYLVQRLSKLLYALSEQDKNFKFSYKLIDGDRVEPNNLLRQPFIKEDLFQPKAETLAVRYDAAYDTPLLYKNDYLESAEELIDLFYDECSFERDSIPILLGCVDNNATRQIMHKTFESISRMIYIDSGIDSVDAEGSKDSGYSGQVVCGLKLAHGTTRRYLSPVGEVYSDILLDKDTRLPTQACGEQVVNYPQIMQTNEMAALIMMGYLNTLLTDIEIVSHYTNFNARTNKVNPVYLNRELVKAI